MENDVKIHEHKKTIGIEMDFGREGGILIFERNEDGTVEMVVLNSESREIFVKKIPEEDFNKFRDILQKI